MKPERWQKLDQVFHAALEREPGERPGFLSVACADDAALRRQVDALLAAHEEAGSFIANSAFEVEAQSLAEEEQRQEVVGKMINHYQVISQLGAGGMGEVYLAQDLTLRRQVALKLLPPEFNQDSDRVERFKREARAVSALNHPGIITIHEIGQVDDTQFMATEFIDGATLRQRMLSARLTLLESFDISVQIASALSAAHQAGIIHRDIKPENIMLRRDGIVKVLDFGIAKVVESKLKSTATPEATTKLRLDTEPGIVMGTALYSHRSRFGD